MLRKMKSFVLLLLLSLLRQDTIAFPPGPPFYKAAHTHCSKLIAMVPHVECASATIMAGLGDMLAQKQSVKNEPYHAKRTFKFMLKGLGEGLLWSIWYRRAELWSVYLTSVITASSTNPAMARIVHTFISLFIDLTVACPIIYAFWDIPFPSLMNGVPLREIPGKIKEKLGEMLVASFKVWTPVNVIIYNVPVQYRVFMMSFADVFWQSIVSRITLSESAPVTVSMLQDNKNPVRNPSPRVVPVSQ